ncbi:hypothetical protein ACFPRL_06320 [Pseudoclavibacter helvolus]
MAWTRHALRQTRPRLPRSRRPERGDCLDQGFVRHALAGARSAALAGAAVRATAPRERAAAVERLAIVRLVVFFMFCSSVRCVPGWSQGVVRSVSGGGLATFPRLSGHSQLA